MKKAQDKKSQVRFPLGVWEDLHISAQKHGRSFNGEIIWALRYYLASLKGDTKQDDKKGI